MTNSALRIALATLPFTAALAGCTPLEKKSAIRETITKEPDAAFLKRVKNDPFPAAGQAPKSSPITAEDVKENAAAVRSRSSAPVMTPVPRAGVLGQSNVTVNGVTTTGTNAARLAAEADATAIVSDEEPPTASPTATPTGTATATTALARPLPTRNNIRPLNRPLNGATRRN